jgi:hypothetical protein
MSLARRYSSAGNMATVSTSIKTAWRLSSATTIRPKLYEFTIGTDLGASAADNILTWQLQRGSANGTDTPVTPQAIDTGDPASLAAAGSNATVEPTYTASALMWGPMGINQRATYRWVAPPDGEIVLAAVATANAGFFVGMGVKSVGYTGQADVDAKHAE